jgi:hypothetical protein
MRFPCALLLAWPALCASCVVHPAAGSPATPQRPTFSSSTATTAHATWEVEGGAYRNDENAVDVPIALKYGAGPRTEVFASVSPYRRVEAGGERDSGWSDVVVGARHRTSDGTGGDGDEPARAFQLAAKVPTGDRADLLSSGEIDVFGAWIVDGARERFAWTAFYQLGLLGDPDEGGVVVEHGLALAVGHPLGDDRLSAFGELAAVVHPEWDDRQVFTTLGVALTPHPELVLDAFVVFGLSADAPDAAIGIGFTRNLGGAHAHPGGAVAR